MNNISIRNEDVDRLKNDKWLNDSLIDFWNQWISRNEGLDSMILFFTTHFMENLTKHGPEFVRTWTAKREIDIFKKKLIILPINDKMHWSLCVVVNPGKISNNYYGEGECTL